MNRSMMIHRLRGPALLLLVGFNALLAQAHILGWGKSWPFYLILIGVLQLAERLALTAEGGYSPAPIPGAPQAGAPGTGTWTAAGIPAYPGQPVAQSQSRVDEQKEGGQS